MAIKAPSQCPACGSTGEWVCTGEVKKGISAGKAVGGAIIAGPVGALVGGALGKKKFTYYCMNCGFREDYDEKANPPKKLELPKSEDTPSSSACIGSGAQAASSDNSDDAGCTVSGCGCWVVIIMCVCAAFKGIFG